MFKLFYSYFTRIKIIKPFYTFFVIALEQSIKLRLKELSQQMDEYLLYLI